MSATTVATSGGFPHSHAVNEKKTSHASLKGKGRTGQLQSRQGKTIQSSQAPLVTPRKALSEIQNSKSLNLPVSHTPVQKPAGHNTRPFQLSTTKSEKLLGKESNSKYKPKKVWAKGQSTGVLPTRAHHSVARSSVKVQEEDEFPDIETMPERVDEFEQDWLFIPPSYFDVLTTALKSMHIPPTWGSSPIDVLPSLQLKLDTIHRPTSFSSDSSILAPLGVSSAEDNLVSVELPELPDLDNL